MINCWPKYVDKAVYSKCIPEFFSLQASKSGWFIAITCVCPSVSRGLCLDVFCNFPFTLKHNIPYVETLDQVWSWTWSFTKYAYNGPNVSTCWACLYLSQHGDVIKWKHFPRYWPFVRGIHRSPVNSQHKGQWRGGLMFPLICALNKRLSKQWWGWWFETPSRPSWRHRNEPELSLNRI